jgi:hypothetical protein
MKKYIFSSLLIISMLLNDAFAQTRKGIATFQFAGSIGFVSMGAGITSKSQKLHNEFLYGFVPSYYGGPLNKVTYKLTYYPFQKHLNERVTWLPISIGGALAYNLGNGYSLLPSYKKYDKDYYWWSSGLRKHITISTSLKITPEKANGKEVLLYFEANTNDLYLSTMFDNVGNMSLTDIVFLGMGVKSLF